MEGYSITNLVVSVCSVALLVLYHVWLAITVRRTPEKTVFGVTSIGRRHWVSAMMKGKKDILAIQSLRNLIMVSSILASTSVVLTFGFIGFLSTVASHPVAVETDGNPLGGLFGFALDEIFGTKILVLLLVFGISFFCFAQAMRFYNHTGMMINMSLADPSISGEGRVPMLIDREAASIEFVATMLNRGSFFHTAGLRAYYVAFPVLAYLWGPWALLVGTILLVLILRVVDFNFGVMTPSNYAGSQDTSAVALFKESEPASPNVVMDVPPEHLDD